MKSLVAVFLIPITLFAADSLRLDWHEVDEEQNGIKLLADIHEQVSSLESAKFYDLIEKYEDEKQWDEAEVTSLLEGASQIEEEIRGALKHDMWQVDGFYTPDTLSEELEAFHLWRAIQRVRFLGNLIAGRPEKAYTNCRDLSYSGLKLMGAKGGTLHFLIGLSAYNSGLELLSELDSAHPSVDFLYFGVPTQAIRELYRDAIRHEYGSALNLVDYLVKQLGEDGHASERALIQVQATKELITEAYQEALDNSFREPSEYDVS